MSKGNLKEVHLDGINSKVTKGLLSFLEIDEAKVKLIDEDKYHFLWERIIKNEREVRKSILALNQNVGM